MSVILNEVKDLSSLKTIRFFAALRMTNNKPDTRKTIPIAEK